MRKKRTMEQRLQALVKAEAKHIGLRSDLLTMAQWRETLDYFNYRCAYCGGPFQIIEHYLADAGTTVSNCVPACFSCNTRKDAQNHDLSFYQNERVLAFIESKGVNISFHVHEYEPVKKDYVILHCAGCGWNIDVPGLPMEEAREYIEQFFKNTSYAYID